MIAKMIEGATRVLGRAQGYIPLPNGFLLGTIA